MHPDVQSLLAVQVDDLQLYALDDQLTGLAPKLAVLQKERAKVNDQLERTGAAVLAEESKHREVQHRSDANRALVERSQRAYESVTTPKEAAAAMTQLEQTKRMVDDSERDAALVQGRINELRHQVADLEKALVEVESRQAETRTALEAERTAIEAEITTARAKRDQLATAVPRSVLDMYDKVRSRRRAETLFPLRGASCSACDTAIPTQRRASMTTSGAVEMCEGCGVLLYAGE